MGNSRSRDKSQPTDPADESHPSGSALLTQDFEIQAYDYTAFKRVWHHYAKVALCEQLEQSGIPTQKQAHIEFPDRQIETVADYLQELIAHKKITTRVMMPLFDDGGYWTVLSLQINTSAKATLAYFIDPIGLSQHNEARCQALTAEIKSVFPSFSEKIQLFSPQIHDNPQYSGPLCLENMITLAQETYDEDCSSITYRDSATRAFINTRYPYDFNTLKTIWAKCQTTIDTEKTSGDTTPLWPITFSPEQMTKSTLTDYLKTFKAEHPHQADDNYDDLRTRIKLQITQFYHELPPKDADDPRHIIVPDLEITVPTIICDEVTGQETLSDYLKTIAAPPPNSPDDKPISYIIPIRTGKRWTMIWLNMDKEDHGLNSALYMDTQETAATAGDADKTSGNFNISAKITAIIKKSFPAFDRPVYDCPSYQLPKESTESGVVILENITACLRLMHQKTSPEKTPLTQEDINTRRWQQNALCQRAIHLIPYRRESQWVMLILLVNNTFNTLESIFYVDSALPAHLPAKPQDTDLAEEVFNEQPSECQQSPLPASADITDIITAANPAFTTVTRTVAGLTSNLIASDGVLAIENARTMVTQLIESGGTLNSIPQYCDAHKVAGYRGKHLVHYYDSALHQQQSNHTRATPPLPSAQSRQRCSDSHLESIYLQQRAEQDASATPIVNSESSTSETDNPYRILGVASSATEENIKKAFHTLSRIHHPDKGGKEEIFKKINDAYQHLNEPEIRQQFDEEWRLFHTETLSKPASDLSTAFRANFLAFHRQFQKAPAKAFLASNYFTGTDDSTTHKKPPPPAIPPAIPVYLQRDRFDYSPNGMSPLLLFSFATMLLSIIFKLASISSLEQSTQFLIVFGALTSLIAMTGRLTIYLDKKMIAAETAKETAEREQKKYLEKYPPKAMIPDNFNDIFAYITAQSKLNVTTPTTALELILTPETIIKLVIQFFQGNLYGTQLDHVRENLKQQSAIAATHSDSNLTQPLYQAVIQLISLKALPDNDTLLTILQAITSYAENTKETSIALMLPLFRNKSYQSLFTTALQQYWQASSQDINDKTRQAYDGQQAAAQLIETIKSNRSNPNSVIDKETIRYVRNLQQFEKEAQEPLPTTQHAEFYRDKAYQTLDWISLINEDGNNRMVINILLQAGLYFQNAAITSKRPARKMAYEKLAFRTYMQAFYAARRQTSDIELYALLHSLRYMSAFQFGIDDYQHTIPLLQARALYLAKAAPFFDRIRSNIYWSNPTQPPLDFRRQYLKSLLAYTPAQHDRSGKLNKNLERSTALYQAYEACLKDWFEEPHNPETEQMLRTELMQQLLANNDWNNQSITNNVSYPSIMNTQDKAGWPLMDQPLSVFTGQPQNLIFKAINGYTIDHKTGDITLLYEKWHDEDNILEQYLTPHDVKQMLNHGLTGAVFSLDPVEPNQSYHPFNTMRFEPPSLYQTEFLNTLFLADYLLKFLTVGYVVQGQPPYALCPAEDIILSQLPDPLRKIIDDFRNARDDQTGTEDSVHRFWIEATHLEAAITHESHIQRVAVGKITMVVNKHLMIRNDAGDLIDADESQEGWDCYVLKADQWQPWITDHLRIKKPTLVFIKDKNAVYHIDQGLVSECCSVSRAKIYLDLLNLPCDEDHKVIATPNNKVQRYQITRTITDELELPHHYSPEAIFAFEFTAHYDDFAAIFPELGRLKAFCRLTLLVGQLIGMRETNRQSTEKISALIPPRGPGPHQTHLTRQIRANKQLEKHLTDLGLNTKKDHHPPDNACPWVPASVWHSNSLWGEHRRSRLVYGGVLVTPKVNDLSGTPAGRQLINQTVYSNSQMSAAQLALFSGNPSTLRAQNHQVHTMRRRGAGRTPAGSGAGASSGGQGRGQGAAAGGSGGDGGDGKGPRGPSKDHKYHMAPDLLPAFPGAQPAKCKTPRQGGGGKRDRWKDKKHIYEWDYQHGTVEKYNKRGNHQGEFDPETGRQLKPPDPSRNIKKYL